MQAAIADERAQTPPHSAESRLWSVAEQVLKVVGDATEREEVLDAGSGYYLRLAIVLLSLSTAEGRDELSEKLTCAFRLGHEPSGLD